MSDVVLIDTSVFCELLAVPGLAGNLPLAEAEALFVEGWKEGWVFLLPWATVLETGNHIGQVGYGPARAEAAQRFADSVLMSLDHTAPWSPSTPLDAPHMERLLGRFPEWALHMESGLGDLSIVQEWERQTALNPRRRVWIWSLDKHLKSYDSGAC